MMRKILVFTILCVIAQPRLKAQPPEELVQLVAQHWLTLNNNFRDTSDVWGNYTLDLTLEALLCYDDYTNNKMYSALVHDVMKKRGIKPADTISHKKQPFCSVNFTLGKTSGNDKWFNGFIAETYQIYKNAVKSAGGAVMINHQNNHRVLIDYMQEYACRMAKTGYLTGDTVLFSECVNQFKIYESLLMDEHTGLWSQGRGFCEDTTKIAEGAWSRGHGWLLRGMVSSMLYLPGKYQSALMPVLKRVSHSILTVQNENGMFHILLNLPHNKSEPDISGTGMISYYLSIAVEQGWLDTKKFKPSILKATNELRNYVGPKGEIYNSSKGPGPLCSQDEYINYTPKIDEKHGFQAIIYGMLAEIMLRD